MKRFQDIRGNTAPGQSDTPRPVVLRQGFRLFFPAAALWAIFAMALFLAMMSGFEIPAGMPPVDWHIHELLFGYTGAVIAGFLLTAVPNWTGRAPISGLPLLGLFAAWAGGRLAIALSADALLVATVDLAFPVALVLAIGRELVAAGQMRNLRVLVLVFLHACANAWFHVECARDGGADYGTRAGIAVLLLLIMVIGGRIVPAFTRNWLARKEPGALPAPFGGYDGFAIVLSAIALAGWVAFPQSAATALALALAGVSNMVRLARWAGHRTFGEFLLAVLHIAYGFIPAGLVAMAVSIMLPLAVPLAASIHLLTVGAIGLMTLAVMTRASLGHSGEPLHADRIIVVLFSAALFSVIARTTYAYIPEAMFFHVGAAAWMLAFVLFVSRFGKLVYR